MEALEEIDPGWCPVGWGVSWPRTYRLVLAHVKAGDALPAGPREVVVQGEDRVVWISGQNAAWPQLTPAQTYLLATLGIDPDNTSDARPAPRSRDARWATNLAAAHRFHAREGHLRSAHKHVELVDGEEIKLGSFLDNTRAEPPTQPRTLRRAR